MNNIKELYELHERFNKHEFKNNLMCECGLIYKNIYDIWDEENFEKEMDNLLKGDLGIIKQIAELNLSIKDADVSSLYLMCNYFAKFGIENFKEEIASIILHNGYGEKICQKGNLDFIFKLKNFNSIKIYYQRELAKRGTEEQIINYIKKYKINYQGLLFKIPYKYYDLIKISEKDYYQGEIDENIDVDDLIRKLDFLFNKNPKYIFGVKISKSIFEEIIKRRRLDLACQISPIATAIYISEPGFFSEEELKDIKDTLKNKYKIAQEIIETNEFEVFDDPIFKINNKTYKIK